MKRLALVSMLIGLALLIGLVLYEGLGEISTILKRAGLVLCWLVPLHVLPLVLDARGWQVLLRPHRASLAYLSWVASVREAVNRLLPAANIGGEVVGIRLVAGHISTPGLVAASVIAEVLLTMVGQYLLCALGVVLTLFAVRVVPQIAAIMTALALSLMVPLALAWLLRHGALFTRLERLVQRLIGSAHGLWSRADAPMLDQSLSRLLQQHRQLALALALQLGGMVLGCGETWLALLMLGHPVGPSAAISIEALSLVIRSAVFFVPGGLGVQEAGTLVLAQLFGIGADMALSLALVRRMREILFGVPALISWQWFEARRLSLAQRSTS